MKKNQSQNFGNPLSGKGDLGKKIFFVIFILIIYRLGTYIPLPGVNLSILDNIVKEQAKGILGMFNVLTGGALGRMSIFTLNIMPYITASIIMQLMTVLSKEFSELKKSGEVGRQKINQYSKYLSVVLALFQGYGIAVGIESLNYKGISLISDPGIYFRIVTMFTLMGGTIVVIWFADQINMKGIGNGSSVIIFSGIVSGLLPAVFSLLEMGKSNVVSTQFIILCFIAIVAIIVFVVFMEKSQRKLLVQYPRKQVGKKIYAGDSTHLPIKINVSGVIPPIFANALLLFPATIAGFSIGGEVTGWRKFVESYLSQGKPLYLILYILFIMFFCFFYSTIVFNPEETAENLRKNGAVIIGRRPGNQTKEYLQYILTRITVIGASYIAVVCAVPEVLTHQFSMPFYLGGTSILIVISVVLDLSSQIQSHLLSNKYAHLMKKANMMRRR
ncbi:preprotein translocase subunit SecY [Candidatus Aquarickettsia rohweri]|uniref:Protein translocase subunit SecY n=1 Tax=Candidatus Aquarickettsia rohweri TaxID=2602574 RepID=A0A3R9YAV0_9RICK|nr:preprotein translocase subunit SecY [Candidatus Aquarickettsia rohweri]RST68188.1 preprotein translocase subunit SecY [Candidatus Aquarickettsia rohweri]